MCIETQCTKMPAITEVAEMKIKTSPTAYSTTYVI